MPREERDQRELHVPMSSRGDESVDEKTLAALMGLESDANDQPSADEDLVENGFGMATHGGGTLEDLPDYSVEYAMTEGFEGETVELDEATKALPSSCSLEFETPESVCGRDDRVHVTKVTRIPWRWVCQLIMDGRSRCTGWFIGPRTIMTAGHCVYSHRTGKWASKIEVIPGMNGASRPYGSQVATWFWSVNGWVHQSKPSYDYGAIILPDDRLGRMLGWYGFANLSENSLKHLLVNNSGYPGDKPFGTQWFNAGRITQVQARRLFYMIDTAGGQSGSPIWRYSHGHRHAVGIHGYGGCPNAAARITRPVFRNMLFWKYI